VKAFLPHQNRPAQILHNNPETLRIAAAPAPIRTAIRCGRAETFLLTAGVTRPTPTSTSSNKTRQGAITMTSSPIARLAIPFGTTGALRVLLAGAALTALADGLFYLHAPGISVAIFAAALGAAASFTNPVHASRIELATALAVLAAALLPSIEEFGLLSLVFAVAGACVFSLLVTGWPARSGVQRVTDAGGAFVLAAMQPGTSIERSRLARALVFLWIGQNVLLVLSSMLRLDLYVDAYSLTAWRCAAFVWMLLVAAGLVLIVARIALDRPNSWLVWSNAVVLALTLYICSLVDFSGLIARFNVMHSREVAGAGQPVDVAYLCRLGPAALPALGVLAAKMDASGRLPPGSLYDCRRSLELRHAMRMEDWRAWTFRGYRLKRFLDARDARASATGARQSMI
jgi:hypothetical protein